MRRRFVVVSAVLCGVLAAGCSTTESGKAQPSATTDPTAATAALWDPCSQIPDSTLTSLGLDVASKRSEKAPSTPRRRADVEGFIVNPDWIERA